jgi:transposase-like protein
VGICHDSLRRHPNFSWNVILHSRSVVSGAVVKLLDIANRLFTNQPDMSSLWCSGDQSRTHTRHFRGGDLASWKNFSCHLCQRSLEVIGSSELSSPGMDMLAYLMILSELVIVACFSAVRRNILRARSRFI